MLDSECLKHEKFGDISRNNVWSHITNILATKIPVFSIWTLYRNWYLVALFQGAQITETKWIVIKIFQVFYFITNIFLHFRRAKRPRTRKRFSSWTWLRWRNSETAYGIKVRNQIFFRENGISFVFRLNWPINAEVLSFQSQMSPSPSKGFWNFSRSVSLHWRLDL